MDKREQGRQVVLNLVDEGVREVPKHPLAETVLDKSPKAGLQAGLLDQSVHRREHLYAKDIGGNRAAHEVPEEGFLRSFQSGPSQ